MDDSINILERTVASTARVALWRYWKVPINVEDKDKTTFPSHLGIYWYCFILFCRRNAPATFKRALGMIQNRVQRKTCLTNINDIFLFSKDNLDYSKDIDEVLITLPGRIESITTQVSHFQNDYRISWLYTHVWLTSSCFKKQGHNQKTLAFQPTAHKWDQVSLHAMYPEVSSKLFVKFLDL